MIQLLSNINNYFSLQLKWVTSRKTWKFNKTFRWNIGKYRLDQVVYMKKFQNYEKLFFGITSRKKLSDKHWVKSH